MKKIFLSAMAGCLALTAILPGCSLGTAGPITLSSVSLYLFAETPSGTITAEIRDATGAQVLTKATVALPGTGEGWLNIDLPDISINKGTVYTIFITRSNAHDPRSDFIVWVASDNGYPGEPSEDLNGYRFCFRTYNGDMIDQESAIVDPTYGYTLYNTHWWGQEFIPGN